MERRVPLINTDDFHIEIIYPRGNGKRMVADTVAKAIEEAIRRAAAADAAFTKAREEKNMRNMKSITYLELLQMIKESKQPETIITKDDGENYKYTYSNANGCYLDKVGRNFRDTWAFRSHSPRGHATEPFIYYEDEILDDAEKRYLKGAIRPFRDNVKVIIKLIYPSNRAKGSEYIRIVYKDSSNTNLPPFLSKRMYAGMELNRRYTLEELGL